MAIRCLVVDDHEVVQLGLEAVFNRREDFEIVGAVNGSAPIVPLIREKRPDVVITALRLRNATGIQICELTKAVSPDIKVIFYTDYTDPLLTREASQSAANGFVFKQALIEELIRAIYMAIEGRMYIDGSIAAEFLRSDLPKDSPYRLTRREIQVLKLLADGYTVSRISKQLFLADSTVTGYVRSAMRKLHSDTRTQAVAFALRHKLLD